MSPPGKAVRSERGADTKDRILDAAERLFAAHGFEGTSLRAVTREAEVNLAAVNYHFGSKEGLMRAVLGRRIEPITVERLSRLDALEAGDEPPDVREVIRAFVGPVFRQFSALGATGRLVMRLMGRMHGEPTEVTRDFVKVQFGETARRFHAAFCQALPDLPPEEVAFRMMSLVGIMTFHLSSGETCPLPLPSQGPRMQAMVERVVAFGAAGFECPVEEG